MSWASAVTLEVSVSFTTAPLDTPSWTDISAYVKRCKVRYGRDKELGAFEPGTLELVLDNSARRFDPLHATGAYYGNLLPNKRVRVRATYSATTYDVFYGFIDGWPQSYKPPAEADITVTATDALKLLRTYKLPKSVYEIEVLADDPWAWWRFEDSTGTQWKDSSGNDRHLDIEDGSGNSVNASDVRKGESLFIGAAPSIDVPPPDAAFAYVGIQQAPDLTPNYLSLEMWMKADSGHPFGFEWYEPGVPGALFYPELLIGTDGAGGPGGKVEWFWSAGNRVRTTNDCVADGRMHHIVVTKDATTITMVVDGVNQALTTVGSVGFQPGVTMVFFDSLAFPRCQIAEQSIYNSVISAARALAHYNAGVAPWNGDDTGARLVRVLDQIGWPSGAGYRNIDTGESLMGPARIAGLPALDYMRKVESTEQGLLYVDHRDLGRIRFESRHNRFTATRSTASQYTLSDDSGATYHYEDIDLRYDERDIVNDATVKWSEGEVNVTDSTSVTAYGTRALTVDTELATRNEAQSLGEWVIARYKDPTVRCKSVRINPAVHTALFAPALGARISDRITVRRLPQNTGSAIEKAELIEGIEHEIDNGVNTWKTTFLTSEADATAYWVWGTATWGETKRWGW